MGLKRKRSLLRATIAFAFLLLAVLGGLVARSLLLRGSLLVEARLSYMNGGQRPVAFATLYLLDSDMMKLALVKEGETNPLQEQLFREHPNLRTLAGVMNARRREAYSLGPDVVPFMEETRPLWQPHVIQTARTDEEGRTSFQRLEAGDYWLMCRAETQDGGVAFWNLFVRVSRGENHIQLAPQNALQCSSCR